MRLYAGRIAPMSEEIVKALADSEAIEVESRAEVVRDLESVFESYLATEREATERAKDALQARGLPPTELPRLKKLAAEQKGIKVGDETMDYLLDQLIEMLMHSGNVDEVYVEDHVLRRTMRPIVKKHIEVDLEIDAEVRGKLKHVQEGSRTWEVEYQRILGDIQRRKGLVR